jgi:hypothetical protein
LGHGFQPAYLEIIETSNNQFDVVWKIPLRGDLRPPITPTFPPDCSSATLVTADVLPGSLVERWRMDCGEQGLEGQTIEISGLPLTLMDVFLHIEMKDGRIYDAVIRGSDPSYTVQPGPSTLGILQENILNGLRLGIGSLELWVLVAAMTFFFVRKNDLLLAIMLTGLGYTVGFVAGAFGMILIDSGWGRTAISLLAFALILQKEQFCSDGKNEGLYKKILLSGIVISTSLLGASSSGVWSNTGLATFVIPVALFTYMIGLWVSLFVMMVITTRIRLLLGLFNAKPTRWPVRIPAYIIGAGSAFLVFRSLGVIINPGSVQPFVRPESVIAALVFGYWAGRLENNQGVFGAFFFSGALAAGLTLAALTAPPALVSTMVPVSIALLGVGLAFNNNYQWLLLIATGLLSGLFLGWTTGIWLTEHMGLIRSSAVGVVLLCGGLLFYTHAVKKGVLQKLPVVFDKLIGLGFMLIALLMRLYSYEASTFSVVSTLGRRGGSGIPAISIILFAGTAVALVILVLRLKRKKAGPLVSAMAAALFIVGLGMYSHDRVVFARPIVSMQNMSEDETKVLITDLLQNTYRAVNLTDEFEIYDKLALSVHGDLVEKIYLESRKRTVLPNQDSPEVQMIEVNIRDIMEAKITDDRLGYTYTCEWYVSGTIRHWAHQHNRQNRYIGLITVKRIDDAWKITEWELLDEQRIMDS